MPIKSLLAHNSLPQLWLDQSFTFVFTQGLTSVSLSGGRSNTEGYVRVSLIDGRSGSICADDWDLSDAAVVCRELGLDYADRATTVSFALYNIYSYLGNDLHLAQQLLDDCWLWGDALALRLNTFCIYMGVFNSVL